MRTLLPWVFLSFVLLSGCGSSGGGGVEEKKCVIQKYDKKNLPPYPYASKFLFNPLYFQQWGLHYDAKFYDDYGIEPHASLKLDEAHRFLGRSVKVAIIDDALDVTHEDLKGRIKKTYDVVSGTSWVMPHSADANHGTEITGVIAANNNNIGMVGVAPESEIYFIRIPLESVVATVDILEAFKKAKEWDVDVVNCSWGTGDVQAPIREIIEDLAKNGRDGKGTVIVFAAGNSGEEIPATDEAALPEVIAVGASSEMNDRTYYSAYGDTLDVLAPGGETMGITTLDQMGDAGLGIINENYLEFNDYHAFAGTSASAALVSGVVALLLEANPNLTRENVQNALRCSADKIGPIDYGEDGFDPYYGYGKVNAQKALKLVR